MTARATNTTLLLLVLAQCLSGLGSFLVGTADWRWVTWLHNAGGFTVAVLLFWKGRIILRSMRRRGFSVQTALSLALLGLLLITMATGLLSSSTGLPQRCRVSGDDGACACQRGGSDLAGSAPTPAVARAVLARCDWAAAAPATRVARGGRRRVAAGGGRVRGGTALRIAAAVHRLARGGFC
jgi:hypothetical protein